MDETIFLLIIVGTLALAILLFWLNSHVMKPPSKRDDERTISDFDIDDRGR